MAATTDTTRKPASRRKPTSAERRDHLRHAVHHTAHMLSEQGPMNITFVHNNTLLGLQKQHFHDAIETARATMGTAGYEPDAHFLASFARGRITAADLAESLTMQPGMEPLAEVARVGERVLTQGEVLAAALRADAAPRRPQAALRNDFEPECGLLDLGPEEKRLRPRLAESGAIAIDAALARIGTDRTLSEWLGAQFAVNAVGTVAEVCATQVHATILADATRALDAMGIPFDLRAGYLARAQLLWGDDPALALAVEARLVARMAEERLYCAGRLADVVAAFRADPAGYAVRSLHSAISRGLGSVGGTQLYDVSSGNLQTSAMATDDAVRPLEASERALLAALVAESTASEDHDLAAARRGLAPALAAGVLRDADMPAIRHLAEAATSPETRRAARLLATRTADEAFSDACAARSNGLIASLSDGQTLSDALAALTGIDLTAKVNAAMVRHLAAFTDEGLAALRMPDRHLGLFTAWRKAATADALLLFEAAEGWRIALADLPEDPADALIALLDAMGVPDADWEQYLGRCLVQLKGWAGMMFWLEIHPGHYKQKEQPADTIQYLAMRLFTEKVVADRILAEVCGISSNVPALRDWAGRNGHEVLLRLALHAGEVAPDLAEAASLVLSMRPPTLADRADIKRLARRHWLTGATVAATEVRAQDAARVLRCAAQLGLSADDVATAPALAPALLSRIEALPPATRGRIWLEAYELHYRDEVLNALSQNKGRGRWINGRDRRPRSQVVFCIDEREENLHRYYGELDPDHETLGAAGFFGIAIAHSPLGGHDKTPLCPAVATPAHCVAEVPREVALDTVWPVAQRRTAMSEAFHAAMWETKRNPVVAFFVTQLTGLFHAVPLVGRIFAPMGYHRLSQDVAGRMMPTVPTRLTHTRLPDDMLERLGLHAASLPFGFTVTEAADRVEAQLRNWGLTYQFAKIVVICAHRSFSVNNPHENAHDCGACGGKAGGPNARLFAALSNEPEVRAVLRERGIDIPADTRFVGAEHNTCNDDILTFDTEDIPPALAEDWERVAKDLEETSRRAARERCRRFRSAPKDATPAKSWEHVRGRSQDLSQVRPEWGHATNAFALVGRRALTQGLFFDRRGFVISYDPTQDGDGRILERILMAVGPVGAGINLEYYFSTVNPDGYGSGTKVPHNVVGMIGVMPGAQGDLATGLPRQMTEVHEAMRLQLIVDAPLHILGEIYGRQPAIQELLNGQWVHLIAHNPEDCTFHRFVPGVGFEQWNKPLTDLTEVPDSYDWIRGKHDCFLPPARIAEPTARWDGART